MHCRGFGIQSPSDYRFVRYVINEHWPYYAFASFPSDLDSETTKLGKLYFRLANYRQPSIIIDRVGMSLFLRAACSNATILTDCDSVELAIIPIEDDYDDLFNRCHDASIVVFHQIYRDKERWEHVKNDHRVQVTYDLYYCGIVFFDTKRYKQHYIVNF